MPSVLFVCMGNICRSPAAEGVMKHLLQENGLSVVEVFSCGIGDWHLGSPPDYRMQEAAKARCIALLGRAKQFQLTDYEQRDYILCSDHEVLALLHRHAPSLEAQSKLFLMTHFSEQYAGQEIPDPYYAPHTAFDLVLDMLEESCSCFIQHLKRDL